MIPLRTHWSGSCYLDDPGTSECFVRWAGMCPSNWDIIKEDGPLKRKHLRDAQSLLRYLTVEGLLQILHPTTNS
ncbi:hypothetical protein KIN20_009545 [Parelaphostrongylus tenuis]|uniref:Uncharacterized protein n=1 Tax=Parelaphostrongylus tenuis TaxID=148309 RepID=A0AAD5QLA8_PARTN|nr:hypothetical protein KIN20_009545 [Parelaphostrongylus tenuis]